MSTPPVEELQSLSRPTRWLLFYSRRFPLHSGKWRIIHWVRQSLKLSAAGEFVVQRQGLWWSLNVSDYTQSLLFWYGARDRWEIHHLVRLARPRSVFFDIGANFGYYSVLLASRVGAECTVHAFEPNPPTFERLQRNAGLNSLSNVKTYCLGFSDVSGSAAVIEPAGNSGATHLVEGAGVELTTLDRFCQVRQIRRLDFIKIDVEGFEEKVLAGAAETLARFKPIIVIELNPGTLKRAGSSVQRVAALLGEHGYTLFKPARTKLVPLLKLPEGEDYINAFCFPGNQQTFLRLGSG